MLAISLARLFNGEIVNADSRQVYRYMDIGTAKPTVNEMNSVPHHLFNIIDPDTDFSLAQYQEIANKAITDIQKRRKIPFLVGGSGQYVWGVLEGWQIPHVPPNLDLRKILETRALNEGIEILFQQLLELDPAAAEKIDKRNVRRVIRALEVSILAKRPFSELRRKSPPEYETLIIGLTADREELYRRIDLRAEDMIRGGLVEEVAELKRRGYDDKLPSMSSIGYCHMNQMLKGELTRDEAIRKFKVDNHRFVRHQYAWFRLKDKRIQWFDICSKIEPEIIGLIANFLQQQSG
jgi:tRNA dimethylallyltransferase